MIEVTWNSETLAVTGHATGDDRVCAAISAGCATLVSSYGASDFKPGEFRWNPSSRHSCALEFFLKMALTLVASYPAEIKVTLS